MTPSVALSKPAEAGQSPPRVKVKGRVASPTFEGNRRSCDEAEQVFQSLDQKAKGKTCKTTVAACLKKAATS